MKTVRTRFPAWIKKRLPPAAKTEPVLSLLRELELGTVCQAAHCPNMGECFARGTATFMILGTVCTRNCTFCAVEAGEPAPPDSGEPFRVAAAAQRLGLRHVVITSVTRDDLPDGGSRHFAATVRAIHVATDATVEALTPDFAGRLKEVDRVLDAGPEVFNHNVETVPRLYPAVRPEADWQRSLAVLARAAESQCRCIVKSGLMLGLGETADEVEAALAELREAGCRVVTIGQYLAPSQEHHPVVEFVRPERFAQLEARAREMGFDAVASGPFVRSSYGADAIARDLLAAQH
ncbi:MAG: lipoyl synthase [Planctomycetota bacterium]